MADRLFTEIAIVFVLTIINAGMSMSELAVVSSRPARLKMLQDQGRSGAGVAMLLAENPGRFLSTVQIGITLVGVMSGAFSGATLGARLSEELYLNAHLSKPAAEAIGVGAVVVAITLLQLVVGELVPKQLALRDPERIAARVAPFMSFLSKFAWPLVWLLDRSGRLILQLLRQDKDGGEKVTEEEVKTLLAEAESAGVLETEEKDMIASVMRLADRKADGLMTPRRDVETLDLSDPLDKIRAQIHATHRYQIPVQDGGEDDIVGIVYVKEIMEVLASEKNPDLRAFIHEAPIVTDNSRALDVIQAIRAAKVRLALVFDEYGHFEGIVTSGDLLESIVGIFDEQDGAEPALLERSDGSFLVSGWMPIDEFADRTGFPIDRDAHYTTVAGLALHRLGRLPETGEVFSCENWRFEIVDMDGRRIDKLVIEKPA